MATGLFLPVVPTPAQPLLIVNTGHVQAPMSKETPKGGKRKSKGRWIQIRPHPVPARIPFGKIPIPALRSNFTVKKKRLMRKRIRVKEKMAEKRKSQEVEDLTSKKSKVEETKDNEKGDSVKSLEEKIEEPKIIEDSEKVEKPMSEMIPEAQEISAPLSHSDLSNDIFASLQVPSGGSNAGCLSPTAAFLMTFPVVSSTGGKNPETALSEESPSHVVASQVEASKEDHENSSALLDNLSSFFAARDDYTALYPESLEKTLQKPSEKIPTDAVISNPIRIRTDMGIPQKPMESQISFADTFTTFDYSLSNNCGGKINSSVFPSYSAMPLLPEMAPAASANATKCEFTFSLTKTTSTAPCSSYKADSLYNPFSFSATSTSSSVINSMDTNLGLLPLNISSSIYPNVPNVPDEGVNKAQGSFTFSLTNTTSTPSYYAKSSTNLNISFPGNDYPFSFNDPVGIKPTDTSTNFSFSLTSSSAKTTPIYTSTSTYNTLNPFSIDATLHTSNYRQQNFDNPKNYQFYPSQAQKVPQKQKAYQKDVVRSAPKPLVKKSQNQQSKYHNVNWMTNSDYQGKSNDFHIPPPLDFTPTSTFTYPPPPPIDLKSKSDVFFAHPPEENFSWSPNKLSNVLEPPTLHNFMPQTALPTLHGDLALSTTTPTAIQEVAKEKPPQSLDGYQEQQQPGNFLSVSQLLVEQNKKGKKSKNAKTLDESRKKQEKKQFHCMNPAANFDQTLNYDGSKGNQQYSNIYSAESLIGYSKKEKVAQQNYQAPLDLPFPGIEINNEINYNSNILFNPPTSGSFVPQNCMSVFPENDFYDYTGKGASKGGGQQQNYYYKSQNGLPAMDYKPEKVANSTMFPTNKFNNVQVSGKAKKTPNKIAEFYPPPPPAIHSNISNYDSSVPSSNYFSVPLGVNSPHLPTDDPFHLHLNYSSTLKNLAPGNSSLYLPEGSNVSNSGNSLTNFHLSSICPEINDKVRQQNW